MISTALGAITLDRAGCTALPAMVAKPRLEARGSLASRSGEGLAFPRIMNRALAAGDLATRRLRDLGRRVGVSVDAPAAVRRLRDEDPRSIDEGRVAGGGGHDIGQVADQAEFLVTIEDADRRKDLDADTIRVPVDV